MILSHELLTLKAKADELWIQGEELESQDFDVEEIDASFDRAFEVYQQVYELLMQADANTKLNNNPDQFEIIQLYYVYKTLATAHFDMGEYELAYELYQNALETHQNYEPLFKKEVKENELDNLRFNYALSKLYALQEDECLTEEAVEKLKESVAQIARILISQLSKGRENKKTGYHQTRFINNLLECKALIAQKPMSMSEERQTLKLYWALQYVLTNEQILNYVTSSLMPATFDEFLLLISPQLSEEQQAKIKAFTPPATEVSERINKMLCHIEEFDKQEEYAKLKLYPYQQEALQQFKTHLAKGNNKGFYVAATGTGKTRIFISKILATNSKTIILVPSISLAEQTKEKLQEQLDELNIKKKIGMFANGEKKNGDIVIMTYNALKAELRKPPRKRKIKMDDFPLVIFDEAHLALTEKGNEIVQELSRDKVVIGCTATDEYNTKRPKGALKSLKELFGETNGYFHYPLNKAIEQESLSPVHICMVTTDTSLRWKRGRKEKKKSGQHEITEKEAAEQINKAKINTVVAEIYANSVHPNTGERLFGKQAVAFCAGVEHAKAVADRFNELFKDNAYVRQNQLTPAAYISGEMSGDEQNKILKDYRAGKILLLCGSDILITGIDNPNICAAFNLRPTRSIVMALQRGGRTVRKSKDFPNKIALIFEFNWVVDGQVFLHDFLDGKHQLGKIPQVESEYNALQTLRREEVGIHFEEGARWELDWTGKVRAHSVGVARRDFDIKVPELFFSDSAFKAEESEDQANHGFLVEEESAQGSGLGFPISMLGSMHELPEPIMDSPFERSVKPFTIQYDSYCLTYPDWNGSFLDDEDPLDEFIRSWESENTFSKLSTIVKK